VKESLQAGAFFSRCVCSSSSVFSKLLATALEIQQIAEGVEMNG